MSVLPDYARYSFRQTMQIASLLADIEERATSHEERIWKFSLARQLVEELNERGTREIPGQAFSGE
jgi:hypothetical protein